MDTGLILRRKYDNGNEFSEQEILKLQGESELLKVLTQSFIKKSLFAIWRIIALSEIPFSENLEYTQKIVGYIEDNLGTDCGFALTGKDTDLLPCYNGMLVEAFTKLGLSENKYVKNGIEWIKKY